VVDVAGRMGVPRRRGQVADGLTPRRSASLEPSKSPGLSPPELPEEILAERGVVAEPATLPVERDDEEARPRKRAEPSACVVGPQHVVAEGSGQPVEHGGAREEPDVPCAQAGHALELEVVRDEPVLPTRAVRGRRVEREGGEDGSCRPAFHSPPEGRELRLCTEVPQQQLLLAVAQGKVGRLELEEAALGPRPRDAQANGSPRERERRAVRHVLGDSGHEGNRAARAQQVHVVEDEQHRVVPREQRRGPARRGAPPESPREGCE
jgi:hypothetical protein